MAYKVKKGDTLGQIARANGTTVQELMKLNPGIRDANVISIGQSITLPGDSSSGSNSGGGGTTPTTDATKQEWKGQTLMNIPGKPEVWKVGDSWYLVYMVPGTEDDPVYMTWKAPGMDAVKSWFGPNKAPVASRTLTQEQMKQMGALNFGTTTEIPPGADNPFLTWKETLRVQSAVQPWILDDDYQTLMAMALVEQRPLTDAEIASTDWWQNHSKAEREWMILYHGDPSTAEQRVADNKVMVEELLRAAGGGSNVDDAIITYMAGEFTQGRWTQAYLNTQITALTDPASGQTIDAGLAKLANDSVDTTRRAEDTVRQHLATWLGPAFGTWSDKEISRIAGLIRNDPDYEQEFIESLKDQRMAVLPEYTDRNTSYAAIANTWKQWWMGQWGQMPDEKDDLFVKVLRNNDMVESGKLLRKEGLARGIEKVGQDLSQASMALSPGERRPVNA